MFSSNKITIKEVAEKAGVSIATVSRFLNKPTSIKKENRERVEKAIKELDYRPLMYARLLAGAKLNVFGLIIPGYEGIFYSYYALEIIRTSAIALNKKGIDLHLHIFWNKDNFKSSLVDGVIFADIIGNEAQLERVIKEGIPTVVLNKKVDNLEVSSVAIDNFKGAYDATEFLINHGHKKITHLAGDLGVQCAQERVEGFKAAIEKNGIGFNKESIKVTNFSRKEAREQLEKIFSSKEIPTAIFCCSDDVASEVLSFAEENKIEIPDKLSVIGFDDNPHCLYGRLMLTTVRQPLEKMTALGVDILEEISNNNAPPKKVVVEPELIIRDTVAFLR